MRRARILVRGMVQGVGFRPFVYRLAQRWSLAGVVSNTYRGVEIEVEGEEDGIRGFIRDLKDPPPGARLHSLEVSSIPPKGESGFFISSNIDGESVTPSLIPDVATCRECLSELNDPRDRRFGYPFINCVHCGPRYTIIERLPYDRENTTMRSFQMCSSCLGEYNDPKNRRFHAQPNACPYCGPHLWLTSSGGRVLAQRDEALAKAVEAIKRGRIVAVKGLGGFHLMCRADVDLPVALLRERKRRREKPLAVMFPSLDRAEAVCQISSCERDALVSPRAPIVVVKVRNHLALSPLVSSGLKTVGVFLPYTPLHHLLLAKTGVPLVATSGNVSEEPLAISNDEAHERLRNIADLFLLHDRPIKRPCDDSVEAWVGSQSVLMRRARGWVPMPVEVPFSFPRPVLALGGHLKNTIAVGMGDKVYLSQHLGDLSHPLTRELLERTVKDFLDLLGIEPSLVVIDKHPYYYSHQLGHRLFPGKTLEVQHHFAHVVACAAERGVSAHEGFIGVALDGTGLGDDGTIWGGEILLATFGGYQRFSRLLPFSLPGGDRAVEEPYRVAFALLNRAGIAPPSFWVGRMNQMELDLLAQMMERGTNSPLTSSMGRLFDGVASLLGLKDRASYEAQAAVLLEEAVDPQERGVYPVCLESGFMDWRPIIHGLLEDLMAGEEKDRLASKFHNSVIELLVRGIVEASRISGIRKVALSGGVFQNRVLLVGVMERLKEEGLIPLTHCVVPPNDGGISLGQAVIGGVKLREDMLCA